MWWFLGVYLWDANVWKDWKEEHAWHQEHHEDVFTDAPESFLDKYVILNLMRQVSSLHSHYTP